MKRFAQLIAIIAISVFSGVEISAQCEPDTADCKDTGNPGEICPRELPDATIDVAYDEVITVIPPGEAVINDDTIEIVYIEIDSVINLPPGINYFPNALKFYPDTAYCIQITGTPTEAGEFQLAIYVSPYIYFFGILTQGPQVIDDTSVVMVVHSSSGFNPYQVQEFQVLQNVPNPFSEVTRMGFFTPFDDRIELKVYNILGELMHQEEQGAPPGEHYFEFNGNALLPGTYFYRVNNSSTFFTGKFIKVK